jgi:hypothetical protein
MILATLLLNPYAGTYDGFWRLGFLTPKTCRVRITPSGHLAIRAEYQTRMGRVQPDGTFHAGEWRGQFYWQGGTLRADWRVGLQAGNIWLTRR